MPLTSSQNPLLQRLRRAVDGGKPMEDGSLIAEGPHLVEEAMASAWRVEHIFCSRAGLERWQALAGEAARRGIELTEVSDRAFKTVSGTEQSQGILALVQPRTFSWPDLLTLPGPLVILDGIQDPGNAGAIVRSTEAFGGGGVVLAEGSVRVSNGKFLRAAAGSLFRLPFLENQARADIIERVSCAGRTMFVLVAGEGASLYTTSFTKPFVLVVGSEGVGVSPLFRQAGQSLSIPTIAVESLNAAIACSVTLFEAARQRL